MSNWRSALAGAVGAVANVGVGAIDNQIKLDQQIDAEKRAGNLQLDLHQRMAAADEMMKNRAAERFATLTKGKLGEDIPVEAPGVDKTGLTDASAGAEFTSSGGGEPMTAAFHGDQAKTLLEMQAVLRNPNATDEQRQNAKDVIDAISAQTTKQAEVNTKGVAGKTRKRTVAEARDAAFDDAAVNDAPAYIAGQSMWHQAIQDARTDSKDKVAQDDKDADRTSREKIAGMNADQRAQAAAERTAVARERIESLAGGKGAKATALMQNYTFMTTVMGKTPEQAQQILFHAKDSTEAQKVFELIKGDKFGDMSTEDAFKKVRGISDMSGGGTGSNTAPAAPAKVRTWNPKTRKFE